jgi:hypothetical protein
MEEALRSVAPLTVYGYARAVGTDKRFESWAEDMVERLVDVLNDEWGDQVVYDIIDEEGQRMLRVLVTDALKQVRGRIVPWRCEVVAKRVLQADCSTTSSAHALRQSRWTNEQTNHRRTSRRTVENAPPCVW